MITLNVNDLNDPIKTFKVTEYKTKQDQSIFCLQKTHLRIKDTHKQIVKGQKEIFHANGQGKK